MDGVITDTVRFHFLSWKKLFDEEDIPFTSEDNRDLLGLAREDSLRLILNRYGKKISPEQFLELFERKNQYFLEMIDQMKPSDRLPGVEELIVQIKNRGLKIAVASSSRNTKFVLERLALFPWFDTICDSNRVTKAKPAPDLFLQAALDLGVPPESAVVIEDSEAGIIAAHRANMKAIGIGGGKQVGQADLQFNSLTEINLDVVIPYLHQLQARTIDG